MEIDIEYAKQLLNTNVNIYMLRGDDMIYYEGKLTGIKEKEPESEFYGYSFDGRPHIGNINLYVKFSNDSEFKNTF